MTTRARLSPRLRALDIWGHKEEQQAMSRRSETGAAPPGSRIARSGGQAGAHRSEIVSQTLEERIEEPDRERALLVEEETSTATQTTDFGTAFEKVRHVLKTLIKSGKRAIWT